MINNDELFRVFSYIGDAVCTSQRPRDAQQQQQQQLVVKTSFHIQIWGEFYDFESTYKLTHQQKFFFFIIIIIIIFISWISSEEKIGIKLVYGTFCAAAALKRETHQGPICIGLLLKRKRKQLPIYPNVFFYFSSSPFILPHVMEKFPFSIV